MFRLFRRRTIWLPTWPVVVGGLVVLLLVIGFCLFGSHRFLAVSEPAPGAEVLVVEAWIADASMEEVARLAGAEGSGYGTVWLVGPPLLRGGHLGGDFDSYAEVAEATLIALGVPADKLRVAPASDAPRHRTYVAGEQLRAKLAGEGGALELFDLVTLDVHARRSRLVYSKLFPDAEVGVIALPAPDYDGSDWFKSSAGVKNVIFELIAYLHEKTGDSGR